ncbi:uncharacterized protein B0T15DRAFT_495656 [Chaetomium strumarium]|uniref:Uncharacterized protein n=1 Tax=Chaetomium strumarium TaxID=1170767 RepID=A0AAJ0GNB0_9PEZI|nr:hypothetical protein B0T15DRAFT_495656 [Chaetomium strumarium]
MTERLHELMRNHREKQIDDIAANICTEMIMNRDKLEELQDMLNAAAPQGDARYMSFFQLPSHLLRETTNRIIHCYKEVQEYTPIDALPSHSSASPWGMVNPYTVADTQA